MLLCVQRERKTTLQKTIKQQGIVGEKSLLLVSETVAHFSEPTQKM